MTGNKTGGAAGQSFIFKIATAVILVLIFGAISVFQGALRQTGGTATTYVKPAEETIIKARQLPPPREPEPELATPQPDPELHSKPEVQTPKFAVQQPLPRLPAAPSPAPAPVPTAAAQRLPAPVTEVHSLSDAEEVMGAASSEVGEVGVTRTFNLPDDDGQSETIPLPND